MRQIHHEDIDDGKAGGMKTASAMAPFDGRPLLTVEVTVVMIPAVPEDLVIKDIIIF